MSTLQTLDRGIRALKIIACRGGIGIAELARELDVARANCYRVVATLASHGLVERAPDGLVRLGVGVPALAAQYWPNLLGRVEGVLQDLSDKTGVAGHLVVVDGDSGVVVMNSSPRRDDVARLGFSVGFRFGLVGAPGIAILAARPATPQDSAEVRRAREQGYAMSAGVIQQGLVGIAAAVPRHVPQYMPEAAIGLAAPAGVDLGTTVPFVLEAVRTVAAPQLEGDGDRPDPGAACKA